MTVKPRGGEGHRPITEGMSGKVGNPQPLPPAPNHALDGAGNDSCRAAQEGLLQRRTFHPTAAAAAAKSLKPCPTLCDPRDGSPSGSPVPGILQARTLEWVAISFSNA